MKNYKIKPLEWDNLQARSFSHRYEIKIRSKFIELIISPLWTNRVVSLYRDTITKCKHAANAHVRAHLLAFLEEEEK